MSGGERTAGVVKIVELVGSSDRSFSDAVRNAVRIASRSIRNIQGVDVLGSSASVGDDGEITLYKVDCKVAFLVEGGVEGEGTASSEAQVTRPTDEPAPGITAETITSVSDGRQA